MSYAYLFKYIIIGDTGKFHFFHVAIGPDIRLCTLRIYEAVVIVIVRVKGEREFFGDING